ncbi:MAG: transcription elongation factor GreA [Coxiella sp. (in: Bacteria)]|nr:MAG: transcription elongation factor GreA [Coxiella sp. (in: g-proteobacteria)]
MNKVPMTVKGEAALRAELDELKRVRRPAVIQAIAEARAHGDLKENAEYHAAREEQGFIEGRIQDAEGKLSNCHVIDVTKLSNEGKVVFGATTTISHCETGEEVTYQIVGEDEADVKQNMISVTSPIARALIGKSVDEEVIVHTPQGEVEYEIIKVDYR